MPRVGALLAIALGMSSTRAIHRLGLLIYIRNFSFNGFFLGLWVLASRGSMLDM